MNNTAGEADKVSLDLEMELEALPLYFHQPADSVKKASAARIQQLSIPARTSKFLSPATSTSALPARVSCKTGYPPDHYRVVLREEGWK